MSNWIEIIGGLVTLAGVIAGGGWYMRKQKAKQLEVDNERKELDTTVESSRSMGEIVGDFNDRMAKMSERLAGLMVQQAELQAKMIQQRAEMDALRAENETLRAEMMTHRAENETLRAEVARLRKQLTQQK